MEVLNASTAEEKTEVHIHIILCISLCIIVHTHCTIIHKEIHNVIITVTHTHKF